MEKFQAKIDVVNRDGAEPALIVAEEILTDQEETYRVTLSCRGEKIVGESERGFFAALQEVRITLEGREALLHCFGASEDVYPSPMQESMGPAVLAYRTRLGEQALSKDIVNIFDSDGTVKPSSVQEQKEFHQRWLQSLA
ncbi:MAG: hypothetical protein WC807_19885 [Hyphomicrobium sp.]|jgi:hypothetical protein